MLAGGEELHQPGGRLRGRSCSRVRSLRLCVPRPPAHHGPTVLARSVHAFDTERSEARYREDARPRYRAVGPRGKRTIRESIPRGIEFPLSVYRGRLWTREGVFDPTTSYIQTKISDQFGALGGRYTG